MQHTCDLLQSLGLFNKRDEPCEINSVPASILISKLKYYLKQSVLESYSIAQSRNLGLIGQCQPHNALTRPQNAFVHALLFDRVVLDDPLASFSQWFVAKDQAELDLSDDWRNTLRQAIEYVADLGLLLREGVVYLCPIAIAAENTSYTMDGKSVEITDFVSDGFIEFVARRTPVLAADFVNSGRQVKVHDTPPSLSSNLIAVRLDGGPGEALLCLRKVPTADDEASFATEADLQVWVDSVKVDSVRSRIKSLLNRHVFAGSFGGFLILESQFDVDVCSVGRVNFEKTSSDAVQFVSANIGRISIPSADYVLKLRDEFQIPLREFRSVSSELGTQFGESGRGVKDAQQVFDREVAPLIRDLKSKRDSIVTSIASTVGVTTATLSLAYSVGSSVPILGAAACLAATSLASGIPSIRNYTNARNSPEFIWSKICR